MGNSVSAEIKKTEQELEKAKSVGAAVEGKLIDLKSKQKSLIILLINI